MGLASFVLVHGSWHGGWCWRRLRALLEGEGHRVACPDLPAHGSDRTSPFRTTLGSYSACVRAAARSMEEPTFVVGHSMGGFASAQAVADEPHLFRGLLYLCAFVPLSGDRLLPLHRRDQDSLVGASTRWGWRGVVVRQGCARELFYGDCEPQVAAEAASLLRPDPYRPAFERCRWSGELAVPQGYLECTHDRAISIAYQREMASRAGVDVVGSMSCAHSPFLSAPQELAAHVVRFAERVRRPSGS